MCDTGADSNDYCAQAVHSNIAATCRCSKRWEAFALLWRGMRAEGLMMSELLPSDWRQNLRFGTSALSSLANSEEVQLPSTLLVSVGPSRAERCVEGL